jgi:hypothetical protein
MRIANFRCPIADLALKKENLKLKLANRKSKYYLLPYYNPKSTEIQLCGHKLYQVYLYQIVYPTVKKNLWLNDERRNRLELIGSIVELRKKRYMSPKMVPFS